VKPTVHVGAEVQQRIARELNLPSRLAHTALLLVSLAGAASIASLLATEPELPARTAAAFRGFVALCLTWSAYAIWVLRRRRVLYATQLVVAARMGVTFSAAFVLASLWLGWSRRGDGPWWLAPLVGLVMLAVALRRLREGQATVATLSRRRDELLRRLAEVQ